MGSDDSLDGHRARRRKLDNDDDTYSRDRKKHYRDEELDRPRRRERSHERPRRRSRSPRRRHSRDRACERRREELSDEHAGRRERERQDDSDGFYKERRRRRSPDDDRARSRRKDEMSEDDDRQVVRRGGPLPSQADSFAITKGEVPEKPKEKPNFGTTGALAAASNSIVQADGSSITLKYHEPPEARKPSPKDQWKLFVFKGPDIVDTIDLNHRSCWLVGRETAVVDLPAEHPSLSKQHAVIQFRYTERRNEYGDKIGRVKPYLIDLESANGTKLNKEKVPDSRYLELRDKDMIQFGHSTREYVLMLAPRD